MLLDQRDEIRGRVPGKSGFREVFVCGNEILRLAMNVGEITAPAAGDQDFLADAIGTLTHRDTPPAFAGLDRAEKARGAATEKERVKFARQNGTSFQLPCMA